MARREQELPVEDITLEDVQLAVKIIRTYLRLVREAESALRELGRYHARGYRRPEDVITEAILTGGIPGMQRPPQRAEPEEELEISSEEMERLQEIKRKVRERYGGSEG